MSKKPKISIEYDGSFPNLCRGKLSVIIDDGGLLNKVFNMDHCLASSGSVSFDENWLEHVTSGKWVWSFYDDSDIPKGFKPYMDATLEVINEQIPHGCCGGCV